MHSLMTTHKSKKQLKNIISQINKFMWAKQGNGKGIHLIGIHLRLTDIFPSYKVVGGLAIKDASIMKTALNCDKILNILNQTKNTRVHVYMAKYGMSDIWSQEQMKHNKVSGISKSLRKDISLLKWGFQICIGNGISTSIMNHLSSTEIPLGLMPTFITNITETTLCFLLIAR